MVKIKLNNRGFDELNLEEIQEHENNEENNQKIELMKKDMGTILGNLKANSKNFNFSAFDKEFQSYLTNHERILYSEVSVSLFDMNNDVSALVKISDFQTNVDSTLKRYVENDPEFLKIKTKAFLKLWDHTNLANNQYTQLKSNEKNLQKRIDSYTEDVKKNEEALENTKRDILTQLISIVSIFVAISFVMFGGMSLINGLFDFSKLSSVPLVEMVCLGSLIGIVMISIMYAFVIFVLRLSFREYTNKSPFRRTYILSISLLSFIFIITFVTWLSNLTRMDINISLEDIGVLTLVFLLIWLGILWYLSMPDGNENKKAIGNNK